jgi:asparagine synthase (glutamine-hydrolysing)
MCGIAGFTWADEVLIKRMAERLSHRGPDGDGVLVDNKVSLACKRLAIIDLSASARQPIFNEDHSLVLCYNGEIYNSPPLIDDLIKRGHRFTSKTDGEVIIHAFEEHGVDSFKLYDGMFAFALYDRRSGTIYLVVDHLGIKNLYFTFLDGNLLFASECKALFEHPQVVPVANQEVIDNIWAYGYNPATSTVFRNIRCLEPGTFLTWKDKTVSFHQYWHFKRTGRSADVSVLRGLLEESVRERLEADVPIAVLLSGGLDSSVVLSLAAKYRPDVKAFALGFSAENNEFEYSRQMAKLCGVDYEEILLSDCDVESDLNRMIYHQETPQDMGSVVPKWYLAERIAKEGYKVVLGGSGTDETWFGYRRHTGLFNMPKEHPELLDISRPYFDTQVLKQPGSDWLYKEYLRESPWYDMCMYYDVFHEIPYYHNPRLDKTFMAWSLEYRMPFLDRALVELSLNTPSQAKMGPGVHKYLLREVAKALLPQEIVERPKNPLKIPQVVQDRNSWQEKLITVWRSVFTDQDRKFVP